ncbi:hypothetical protein [Halostella sp. PRR32]|uniref:DUF7537 family lipoprotein n=1 Tax=Halostella sp. PRR32 TaxID=3098147 RepID=UPI002B1D7A73|nr:hypothetical protein [Halostella sp. PRR32]
MNKRILGILAVVVLVSTAGCAGVLGSDDDDGDDETTQKTVGLDDVTYPDGAAEDGFDNATAVADTHRSALSNASYALELSQESAEGNQSQQYDYTVRSNNESKRMVGSTTSVQEMEGSNDPFEIRSVLYENDTHQHRNVTRNGGSPQVSVRESRTPFAASHESQTNANLVQNLIAAGNYSATEAVQRNGTTLVRYELNEFNGTAGSDLNVSNAEGYILVSEAGVVYEAQVSIEGTSGGTELSSAIEFEVTQVGDVTVERPSWVDDA